VCQNFAGIVCASRIESFYAIQNVKPASDLDFGFSQSVVDLYVVYSDLYVVYSDLYVVCSDLYVTSVTSMCLCVGLMLEVRIKIIRK